MLLMSTCIPICAYELIFVLTYLPNHFTAIEALCGPQPPYPLLAAVDTQGSQGAD